MLWSVERLGTSQLTLNLFWNNLAQWQAHPSLWIWKIIGCTHLMPRAESEPTVIAGVAQNEDQLRATLPKYRQT
jgi:hypothetical protein